MASLYGRKSVYFAKFYEDGKRIRRSLATSSRTRALKLTGQIERDLANGKSIVGRKDSRVTISGEEYLSWAEDHKRPAAIAAEKIFWRRLVDSVKPQELGDTTQQQVGKFKERRMREGLKPKSSNEVLAALMAMLNHARKLGFFNGPNPFVGVERLRITLNPPNLLSAV